MKSVLLVEDERHKREELTFYLENFFRNGIKITHVDSVREAIIEIGATPFDLVVLDMALPTFSTSGENTAGGLDQTFGGIEVIRAMKSKGVRTRIIIITQHPHITVGGKSLKLNDATSLLSTRYSQDIVGGFIYKYSAPSNQSKHVALLKGME